MSGARGLFSGWDSSRWYGAGILATLSGKFELLHDEPILMAQKILDTFRERQYLTSNEIADEVNLSSESVRQVLRSLEKGGFEFEVSEAKGYRPKGGRPKKTATITGKS